MERDELESYIAKLELERLEAAFVTRYADIPNKNLIEGKQKEKDLGFRCHIFYDLQQRKR